MCQICRQYPCDPRCPNAPEPTPVHTCILCGDGIFAGEKYFESGDGAVCKDCMDDKTTEEILTMCGEEFSTAYKEE